MRTFECLCRPSLALAPWESSKSIYASPATSSLCPVYKFAFLDSSPVQRSGLAGVTDDRIRHRVAAQAPLTETSDSERHEVLLQGCIRVPEGCLFSDLVATRSRTHRSALGLRSKSWAAKKRESCSEASRLPATPPCGYY